MNDNNIRYDIERVLKVYDPDKRLDEYFLLLMEENEKVNLVSRETSPSDLKRLAAESLLPCEIIERVHPDFIADRYLDIGSGGGLPAVPLLLAHKVTAAALVERTVKKAVALERIVKKLQLHARVVAKNFEEAVFDKTFNLITLRYIKLTDALLKKIFINLSLGGFFVYYAPTELETYKNLSRTFQYSSTEDAVVKSLTLYQKK
ncbi:MAG: class I SAM-dependent methyltransferase [candidate division Zixibacteria bacterium]|nr:class I SAM-dependent methyltransferase [candidate division Zixibacteria bacterium]MDD5425207.1 class I SAM-dependent methyltransferase [candidate division Zixibacteria bacterium]